MKIGIMNPNSEISSAFMSPVAIQATSSHAVDGLERMPSSKSPFDTLAPSTTFHDDKKAGEKTDNLKQGEKRRLHCPEGEQATAVEDGDDVIVTCRKKDDDELGLRQPARKPAPDLD